MQGQQKGFSLVEIMVGLVIGLSTMLVIMQVFADSEATKRTTTGGADAHTNGAIGLYLLERDIRMAGWGLEPSLYLGQQEVAGVQNYEPGCTTMRSYCNGAASCGGTTGIKTNTFPFAAVSILDGGAGNPDALTLRFFSNPSDENFVPSTNMEFLSDNNVPAIGAGVANSITVASAVGCVGATVASAGPPAVAATKGSLLLLSDPTNGTCTLMQATKINLPVLPAQPYSTIEHAVAGVDGYNPADAWPDPKPTSSTRVSCFSGAANGPLFARVFSVDTTNNNLMKTDNTVVPAVNESVASGIFDLQAQYGIATDSSQNVTSWSNATGGWLNPAPKVLGASGRLQNIKAIRVAVLARSSQYEKPDSANKCQATTTAMIAKWPSWNGSAIFNTANYPAGWDCYRYKVFETLVPLRNVLWGNV